MEGGAALGLGQPGWQNERMEPVRWPRIVVVSFIVLALPRTAIFIKRKCPTRKVVRASGLENNMKSDPGFKSDHQLSPVPSRRRDLVYVDMTWNPWDRCH